MTVIAAVDGSVRLAAGRTPADLSVWMNIDREVVRALLNAASDAAVGNGERDWHASHRGKLSLMRHRPESIGRHPRKVSKSHETGVIPVHPVPPLRLKRRNLSFLGSDRMDNLWKAHS